MGGFLVCLGDGVIADLVAAPTNTTRLLSEVEFRLTFLQISAYETFLYWLFRIPPGENVTQYPDSQYRKGGGQVIWHLVPTCPEKRILLPK